jgi:hypothetical protein
MSVALARLTQFAALILAGVAMGLSGSAAQTPTSPPSPDKPFAEHHLVLQLSDKEEAKQALVIRKAPTMPGSTA